MNAAATLAVLLPPALWIATRSRGPARRRLAGWWALGVTLASAWWLLPLLVLGRYAYPFLDYIESARVTTSVTSVLSVLRGTEDWVAWSVGPGGPSWPAGWWLATAGAAIVGTTAVAALGLAGLARRDLPERRFLLLALLAGVLLMAVGHAGPLAPVVRDLLDGPLAPLRNVHKLDLLVRLPLTIGLCHLLAVGPDARAARLVAAGRPGARGLGAAGAPAGRRRRHAARGPGPARGRRPRAARRPGGPGAVRWHPRLLADSRRLARRPPLRAHPACAGDRLWRLPLGPHQRRAAGGARLDVTGAARRGAARRPRRLPAARRRRRRAGRRPPVRRPGRGAVRGRHRPGAAAWGRRPARHRRPGRRCTGHPGDLARAAPGGGVRAAAAR